MSETAVQDDWVKRVLGIDIAPHASALAQGASRPEPVPVDIARPTGPAIRIGGGTPSGSVIAPPPRPGPATKFQGDGGRKLAVAKSPNGGTLFTAPPPPVAEITFSGGGGKGMALAGAVQALEANNILAGAKVITGASVGSMTAALVAAGITADEFTKVANDPWTTDQIVEGTGGTKAGLLERAFINKAFTGDASPLTGEGLESVVHHVIDATLDKRIQEYQAKCQKDGTPTDPNVATISSKLALTMEGATFMDMRQLSAAIPAIKEVVITGTYTTELASTDDDTPRSKGAKPKKLKNGNDGGQLYVFSADTEPKLSVAVAVHASASFPGAFKPVDIKLSSGLTVRFIDGGVMNNTPTRSSLGNQRDLDPMPDHRGMSFVFEDKDGVSKGLLEGKVKPVVGYKARFVDWLIDSPHAGAEYGKDSDLALRPEEIVVVPLVLPPKAGKKTPEYDMRDGTLEFNVPDDIKLKFQANTAAATKTQIDRENQPKTREFTSDNQMFVSIGLPDLKTMAKSDYPGAADALKFRTRVAEIVATLAAAVAAVAAQTKKPGGKTADALNDDGVKKGLAELNTLAGNDPDFDDYVGREMNRGSLDSLVKAMQKHPATGDAMKATLAVSDALRVHEWAENVLKDLIYPSMPKQTEGGSGLQTLLQMEKLLRKAKTPVQYNAALRIGIEHFMHKRDLWPKIGHKELAKHLQARLMKPA